MRSIRTFLLLSVLLAASCQTAERSTTPQPPLKPAVSQETEVQRESLRGLAERRMPEPVQPMGNLSADQEAALRQWVGDSVSEIIRKNGHSDIVWTFGFGANDVAFWPQGDATEEVFTALVSRGIPVPLDEISCKSWLASCIRSIQTLRPSSTRSDVLKEVDPDGGLSTRSGQIYHSRHCRYLKVRIAYDHSNSQTLDDDVVSNVSTVYLGLTIID